MSRTTYRPAPARSTFVYDEAFGNVHVPHLTVYETEAHWRDSGLLDKDGHPLKARVERDAIGFVRFKDGRPTLD